MLGKSKSAKFFRMALSAVLFAYIAVVFGAYTRLSEAGLGCPDWPGCYGTLFAPTTAQDIEQARALEVEANGGAHPRVEEKRAERAWKEVVQRYIAGALGLLLIRLAVLGWQLKKRKRSQQVLIPGFTMALVFTLAVMGMLTFKDQFKPIVMMMQIIGAMTVLGLLWWIAMREQRFMRSVSPSAVVRSVRPRALIAIIIVSGQIALGGWSMVNYAGLACPDFPTCQGGWWPPMDFLEAFTMWHDLWLNYEGKLLNLPAATAIHMAHRVGAFITLLYVGWLALHVLRAGNDENLCRYGMLVMVLLLAEIALGIMEVVAHLPLALAVGHSAVGALLLMSLVTLYHVVRPPRVA